MNITLLDTKTGETREVNDTPTFQWTENNWSCDCNRELEFDYVEHDQSNTCLGCHRFIVIGGSSSIVHKSKWGNQEYPATLKELNEGYPEELLIKNGVDLQKVIG